MKRQRIGTDPSNAYGGTFGGTLHNATSLEQWDPWDGVFEREYRGFHELREIPGIREETP